MPYLCRRTSQQQLRRRNNFVLFQQQQQRRSSSVQLKLSVPLQLPSTAKTKATVSQAVFTSAYSNATQHHFRYIRSRCIWHTTSIILDRQWNQTTIDSFRDDSTVALRLLSSSAITPTTTTTGCNTLITTERTADSANTALNKLQNSVDVVKNVNTTNDTPMSDDKIINLEDVSSIFVATFDTSTTDSEKLLAATTTPSLIKTNQNIAAGDELRNFLNGINKSNATTVSRQPPTSSHNKVPPSLVARTSRKIQKLLQKPIGAFVYPVDFSKSKSHINYFNHDMKDNITAMTLSSYTSAINASLLLFERNVKEYSLCIAIHRKKLPQPQQQQPVTATDDETENSHSSVRTNGSHRPYKETAYTSWLCERSVLAGLVSRWKDAALMVHKSNHDSEHKVPNTYTTTNGTTVPVLVSSNTLLQSVQLMSTLIPPNQLYEPSTMDVIMKVLILQAPTKQDAPILAEQLLRSIPNESISREQRMSYAFRYRLVLQAWTESGLPVTSAKIDALIHEFHTTIANDNTGIVVKSTATNGTAKLRVDDPNDEWSQVVPYRVVMEYYDAQQNFKKMQDVYYLMNSNRCENLVLDIATSLNLLNCAIKCNEVQEMKQLFEHIVELIKKTNLFDSRTITRHGIKLKESFAISSNQLLKYYRYHIDAIGDIHKRSQQQHTSNSNIDEFIEHVKYIVRCSEDVFSQSDPDDVVRIKTSVIGLYGSAGRIDLAEETFQSIISTKPNNFAYTALIKAYGKCGLHDQAEELVDKMLRAQTPIKPDAITMHLLMSCWTESILSLSLNDDNIIKLVTTAQEKVYHIFQCMKDDQRYIDLNIRTSIVTYGTVLKSLLVSATLIAHTTTNRKNIEIINLPQIKKDIVDKVVALLQEMKDRYDNGEHQFKPDVYLLRTAIKILLLINDHKRAEEILHRMEDLMYSPKDYSAPVVPAIPKISMYSLFFNYYATMRTTDGAEYAEILHNHMRKLSHTKADPDIKPNSTTYNVIFDAWIHSGDPMRWNHLWSLYQQMSTMDEINVDLSTSLKLINSFSYSKQDIDKSRIQELIRKHMQ